mmetsp:Transcript_22501/g.57910  ORF Transcript_22501/g.57910 Transcript_22501/m.57910 type:complete len:542 (-) Transcript_22501:719-2344(-)
MRIGEHFDREELTVGRGLAHVAPVGGLGVERGGRVGRLERRRRRRLEHHLQLLAVRLVAERQPNVRNVGARDVVPRGARTPVAFAEPVGLDRALEGGVEDGGAEDLGQVDGRQVPRVLRDAELLHQRLLRVMEHERIIRREAHRQPAHKVRRERRARELAEEHVVRERRHGDPDLHEVEQVLQRRRAPQHQPVVDRVRAQEGRVQVRELACLARVRPKVKGREAARGAEVVEHGEVGVHVEHVVRVVRVRRRRPLARLLRVLRPHPVRLGRGHGRVRLRLVVHTVEAGELLQEEVELGVRGGVAGRLEQRAEEVVEEHLEVGHVALRCVQVEEARHLHEPPIVAAVEPVADDPARELRPLGAPPAVDGEAVLGVHVLGLLQVGEQLLRQLGEVAPLQEVVGLEEDLPKRRVTKRVVLEVELVEAAEGGGVRVHAERVEVDVVRREAELVAHLAQRERAPALRDHRRVRLRLHLLLDEAQQVLLVHGRRQVDVRVHLAAVVVVAVRVGAHLRELGHLLLHRVQLVPRLEQREPPHAERVHRA